MYSVGKNITSANTNICLLKTLLSIIGMYPILTGILYHSKFSNVYRYSNKASIDIIYYSLKFKTYSQVLSSYVFFFYYSERFQLLMGKKYHNTVP
jgi:hypothetical protein